MVSRGADSVGQGAHLLWRREGREGWRGEQVADAKVRTNSRAWCQRRPGALDVQVGQHCNVAVFIKMLSTTCCC